MKTLLIHPPSANPLLDQVYMHEPLALEYLGAGLKKDGHEVQILDARIDRDIGGAFHRFRPDMVGLTAFTSHVDIVKKIAEDLKRLKPDLLVVVGGHHATVSPHDFNLKNFDLVVVGEGVQALREIARCAEAGEDFSLISGLGLVRPETELFLTASRPYTLLDALPLPDRNLTRQYRKKYFSEWLQPLASIRTSLGCTSRCNFCALWPITGGKYLRRSVASVVEELSTIEETNVFFCDDESMCDVKRMGALADAIEKAGIRKNYFLYARADTVAAHRELFVKWRKIGLAQVFIGMESFSDDRLGSLHKGINVAQQVQAVRILHNLDLIAYANFMVDPNFETEDFVRLTAHVRQLQLRHVGFSVLTPLPGTELYRQRRHELVTDNPELYDMVHAVLPTRLPLAEFYCQLLDLYTKSLPFSRTVRTLARYGPLRIWKQLSLLSRFSRYLKAAHLET
jgi:hopanoid C-3 methylase